jgi:hypothetical protein
MSSFHDFLTIKAQLGDIKSHAPRFSLDPKRMAKVTLPVALTWQETSFDKKNTALVVDKPGVYAFAIKHPGAGLPPHSYVLYIGQAGAGKGTKARTLRVRFTEYFRDKKKPKRIHIHYFLNAWEGCLSFYFAPVDPKAAKLLQVESILNDAMMPPFSVNDFTAQVRKMKRFSEMFS